jgi:hypothetical protein
MSNERENRGEDQRLADTYKALANERAPDHLNERVLRMAAGRRTPYMRARAWMRPVAWAATIGLSLAIVLEVTRLPQIEPESISIPAPDISKARDGQLETRDSDIAEAMTIAPAAVSPGKSAIDLKRDRPATPATDRTERLSKDDFVPKDLTVLRDAEDMARAQAGSDQGPAASRADADEASAERPLAKAMAPELPAAQPVTAGTVVADDVSMDEPASTASFATITNANERVSAPPCAESVRDMPDTWIACIRQLEENGQEDEARIEYEEFHRVFPDFEDREADK